MTSTATPDADAPDDGTPDDGTPDPSVASTGDDGPATDDRPTTDEQRATEGDAIASDDHADVAPVGAPPRKIGVVVGVALASIAIDQLTKSWAVATLEGRAPIEVIGSLQLNLFYNTGAAFSLGSGKGIGPWITVLALGVVVGLAMGTTSRTTLGAVAAGLIAGGAIGNLIDRAFRGDEGFLHGGVVDFIDLQWWPVFNVADACVVVGAILLVIASFRAPAT